MTTVSEWSNAFDILVASYIYLNAFGFTNPVEFDEYEKSVFLTKALEQLVREIYSNNYIPNSFESNEEARRALDSLIIQKVITTEELGSKLNDKFIHYLYKLNDNDNTCWYIIYELVKLSNDLLDSCLKNIILDVIPVTHDEYQKVIRNPFREPNSRKVLRLDKGLSIVEIVSKYEIDNYTVRYLRKPSPIILTDITSENLTIEGKSTPNTCELSSVLHDEILDRAVRLALSTRIQNKES